MPYTQSYTQYTRQGHRTYHQVIKQAHVIHSVHTSRSAHIPPGHKASVCHTLSTHIKVTSTYHQVIKQTLLMHNATQVREEATQQRRMLSLFPNGLDFDMPSRLGVLPLPIPLPMPNSSILPLPGICGVLQNETLVKEVRLANFKGVRLTSKSDKSGFAGKQIQICSNSWLDLIKRAALSCKIII